MNDYKEIRKIKVKDLLVPAYCIGTYDIPEDVLEYIFSSYEFDSMMIDTAYRYLNESDVGNAYKISGYPRERTIFIGKICYSQQQKEIEEELKQTLNRLQIEYIDIYLIHSPRYENYVETWKEMIRLKDKGYIKHIGVSNFGVDEITKIFVQTNVMPEVNQIVPSADDLENILCFCKDNNILVQMAQSVKNEVIRGNIRNVLKTNLYNNIVSVVGTKCVKHFEENIHSYEE